MSELSAARAFPVRLEPSEKILRNALQFLRKRQHDN
jgi:hypothetical protein